MYLFLLTTLAVIPFLLNRRVREQVTVSSLYYYQLLFNKKVKTGAGPEKFTWEQWLPILILLLMTAALIFYVSEFKDYRRMVVVIDGAARMQMREDDGTRFEAAVTQAKATIRAETPDEVMIIAAEATPRVALPFSRDAGAWDRALESLRPVDTGADLTAALIAAAAAVKSPEGGAIFFFSDARIPDPFLPGNPWQNIHPITISTRQQDNVGITGFNDDKGIVAGQPFFIDVKNFSDKPQTLMVVLRDEQEQAVGRSVAMTLEAGERRRHLIDSDRRAALDEHPGHFTVELDLDDALPLDNVVYGHVATQDRPRLFLITSDTRLDRAVSVFAEFNGYDFVRLAPGQYAGRDFNPEDRLVFHRFYPNDLARHAAVLVGPGGDLARLAQRYQLAFPALAHPVFDGVNLDFFGPTASPDAPAAWAGDPRLSDLRQTPYYGLVYVSESDAATTLLGLRDDIFVAPSNPAYNQEREQVALKLLFNVLARHVDAGAASALGLYRTGDLIPLPKLDPDSFSDFTVAEPGDSIRTLDAETEAFLSRYAGVHMVSQEAASATVLVNFLDENQSAPGATLALDQRLLAALDTQLAQGQSLLRTRPAAWLLLLLLALLAADWLYLFKPWQGKSVDEEVTEIVDEAAIEARRRPALKSRAQRSRTPSAP